MFLLWFKKKNQNGVSPMRTLSPRPQGKGGAFSFHRKKTEEVVHPVSVVQQMPRVAPVQESPFESQRDTFTLQLAPVTCHMLLLIALLWGSPLKRQQNVWVSHYQAFCKVIARCQRQGRVLSHWSKEKKWKRSKPVFLELKRNCR